MAKLTEYRIVISGNASENELRAAAFLRENIRLVCGKKLPLVRDDAPPVPLELVVGETAREALDGISFGRYRNDKEDGIWEYVIRNVNERVYLTGLGLPPAEEPPYTSAYRLLDDGRIGTVLAAYHFVEDVLGYDFVYAAYEDFPENPALEMPLPYEYRYVKRNFYISVLLTARDFIKLINFALRSACKAIFQLIRYFLNFNRLHVYANHKTTANNKFKVGYRPIACCPREGKGECVGVRRARFVAIDCKAAALCNVIVLRFVEKVDCYVLKVTHKLYKLKRNDCAIITNSAIYCFGKGIADRRLIIHSKIVFGGN